MANIDMPRAAFLQELLAAEEAVLAGLHEKIRQLQEEVRLQEYHVKRLRSRLGEAEPSRRTPETVAAINEEFHGHRFRDGEVLNAATLNLAMDAVREGVLDAVVSETFADRIATMLREHKAPMRLMEITNEIMKGEPPNTHRSRLQSTLATALVRRPDLFVRVDRGLYGLAEWKDEHQQSAEHSLPVNGTPDAGDPAYGPP